MNEENLHRGGRNLLIERRVAGVGVNDRHPTRAGDRLIPYTSNPKTFGTRKLVKFSIEFPQLHALSFIIEKNPIILSTFYCIN